MNYKLVETHITNITPGDTIRHNGDLKTVCSSNIKRCKFLGTTLFGDNYHGGHSLVKEVLIYRAIPQLEHTGSIK